MVADGTTNEELTPFVTLTYALEEDSGQESDQIHVSESTNEQDAQVGANIF